MHDGVADVVLVQLTSPAGRKGGCGPRECALHVLRHFGHVQLLHVVLVLQGCVRPQRSPRLVLHLLLLGQRAHIHVEADLAEESHLPPQHVHCTIIGDFLGQIGGQRDALPPGQLFHLLGQQPGWLLVEVSLQINREAQIVHVLPFKRLQVVHHLGHLFCPLLRLVGQVLPRHVIVGAIALCIVQSTRACGVPRPSTGVVRVFCRLVDRVMKSSRVVILVGPAPRAARRKVTPWP
mmetsp:Transcript_843/g.2411  ORF Transcript_843/g.2411 Transcript_843/m.2411 type:complete len:235 (+) Transcript_843:278-982(+)